jgi:hypothetical protein
VGAVDSPHNVAAIFCLRITGEYPFIVFVWSFSSPSTSWIGDWRSESLDRDCTGVVSAVEVGTAVGVLGPTVHPGLPLGVLFGVGRCYRL